MELRRVNNKSCSSLINASYCLQIHPDIVLSAAHCNANRFELLVGPNRERVSFVSKKVHPNYRDRKNDFLVIKLARSFPSITLPKINSDGSVPSGSQSIVVVGYGATQEGGDQSSSFREVTLNHIPHSACAAAYGEAGAAVDQTTMFCAGM